MTSRLRISAIICGLALLAAAASSLDARPVAAGRPLVLVVHGRGYLTRDSADFRRQSLHALRAGAFAATNDSLLADDDVRVVWYADLLDARRAATCDADKPPTSLLQAFASIASELIDLGADSKIDDEVRSLAGDLRFFGNASTRCAAESRIGDAIARAREENRPVVLVGHSLGAMVAWGHLTHRGAKAPEISRFVTIGSPLGSRGLRELLLSDSSSLALPRGVRSWVNVVNENDPFASRLTMLDSTTGRVQMVAGLSDVMTSQGEMDAHELRNYLRAPATVRAVVGAWCGAFDERSRSSACGALGK